MHLGKKIQPPSKGSALLTALFIMTLIAIVATAMSMRVQLDIYRTRLLLSQDKLYLASQAIRFWTFNQLENKKNKFISANQHGMVAKYPNNLKEIYPQVLLSGGLYDLQARFNLNNLLDKKYFSVFSNLLNLVVHDLTDEDKIKLVMAINDWLKRYDLSKGKDQYMSYYLQRDPAYYPSHQLMNNQSELRLVKDINGPIYRTLEPFVTALPETTAININTAPKVVIRTLGNGLSSAGADELIAARGDGIQDLKNVSEQLKKLDIPSDQITIESHYFLSIATAQSDEFKLVMYSLYKRSKDRKGNISVELIKESINTSF